MDVCSLQRGSKQIFLRKDFLIQCIDNLCLTQQRIKCTEGSCPRYSQLNESSKTLSVMQFKQAPILFFTIAALYLFTVDKKQDEIHELHEIKLN